MHNGDRRADAIHGRRLPARDQGLAKWEIDMDRTSAIDARRRRRPTGNRACITEGFLRSVWERHLHEPLDLGPIEAHLVDRLERPEVTEFRRTVCRKHE